ncbi:hypothetical protein PENSPDRAFT_638139 [Peniophora sp. CONT]|nr:hypothetical protein PENSPDRAFT_638139 [Peniophora sp. CONT]
MYRPAFAPTSALSGTLKFITDVKLKELDKQSKAYALHSPVIAQASSTPNLVSRAQTLFEAIKQHPALRLGQDETIGGKIDPDNLQVWLEQARVDGSVSDDIVRGWIDALESHIKTAGQRFETAKLFGNLLNEWLVDDAAQVTADEAQEPSAEPVEVGRKEMFEQRDKLEALIFQAPAIDVPALESYLADLFSESDNAAVLKALREMIEERTENLLKESVGGDDIKWVIESILADANLSDAKRASLRGFSENSVILNEIASVISVNKASLASWSWADGGILTEMRRALNGKYRAATDPDIMDMILLQYVGLKLQPIFKVAFRTLYDNKAVWKQSEPRFTKEQNTRWQKNIGGSRGSIAGFRSALQREQFIAGQLIDSVKQSNKEMAGYREGADDDVSDAADEEEAPATSVPQALLHLVSTECQLAQLLYGHFTVLTTDLRWFGPSLSHETILTVMKFLGLPEPWLSFLNTFLRMPLRFGPDAPVRVRERGTPFSYALASLVGESVLFMMDVAVNQRTQLFLWRNHDDVWLFDADAERCAAAWAEMQRYAGLAGLAFNEEKTGAASVGGQLHEGLPSGDVRWGFLKFSPENARFEIDQSEVDKHIEELGRQLRAARTVFSTVNVWNKYLAFVKRNCGDRPARCLGYDHAKEMASTLARLQKSAVPSGGDIVAHLRTLINERFGVNDLPEGWFYLPMKAGGLNLRGPLPEMFAVMDAFGREKSKAGFESSLEEERQYYRACQDRWEENVDNRYDQAPAQNDFISHEEFIRGRETRLSMWATRYNLLKIIPLPSPVHKTPAVEALLARSSGNWDNMSFFDKWVVAMYGEGVAQKFGSIDPVDSTLIPLGMVNVFTQSRMKWDQ